MSLFSKLTTLGGKSVLDGGDLLKNTSLLLGDINNLVKAQAGKVLADPIGSVEKVVADIPVAIFGRQPNAIQDRKDILADTVQFGKDAALNIFNIFPSTVAAPTFEEKPGSINARPGKVIINNTTVAGASIGDLSWLIYTENAKSNPEIMGKWKLYNATETVSGYNSNTYLDTANKQVAITFEGTSPNSEFSTWVLSKDGLTDVEIGWHIPNQVVEGYERFKTLIATVQNTYGSQGYGISLAGHSLGGGLAQMMASMYFVDTGVALPTLAQEGPGMLRQIKMYAEQQLIEGKMIHLPTGGTIQLTGSLVDRANEAKAIVNTFKAQDFSNVVNVLTEQDVVGQIRYDADPSKDGHIGLSVIMPAILTARECLQDIDYEAMYPINALNLKTPQFLADPMNIFTGLSNMDLSRIDRHLPGQSEGLWSGTSLGLYDPAGDIGLGVQAERTNGAPIKDWAGTTTTIPEIEIFGTSTDQVIRVGQYVTGKKNAIVMSSTANDIIYGSDNGDMLIGGSGNDTIYGGKGDNYISGGTGNAKLYGGTGNDIIYAGSGSHVYLTGGGGNNILFGGKGSNTFYWENGNDIMYNGQAGGNYDFIIADNATGNSQLKWQRNFNNIGTSIVEFNGKMNQSSQLTFNFVDEITMAGVNWSQNGKDIVLTDTDGGKTGTVTFKNAVDAFANNNGQMQFKFTNGSLYTGDEYYNVVAGTGTLIAADSVYAGSVLVSNSGNNKLVSGKGNDIFFSGVGTDQFVFGKDFGNDKIVASNSADTIKFNDVFDSSKYTIAQKGNDLVISYQESKTATADTVTLVNWEVSASKTNKVSFDNGNYSISNNQFVKL